MTRQLSFLTCGMLFATASWSSVCASVTVEIYGNVTSIDKPAGFGDLPLAVGDSLTGFVTYDETATGTRNGKFNDDTPWVAYDQAIEDFKLTIGSYALTFDKTGQVSTSPPGQSIHVSDGGYDSLGFGLFGDYAAQVGQAENYGPLRGTPVDVTTPEGVVNFIPGSLFFGYTDTSGAVFTNDTLPAHPIDPDAFNSAEYVHNVLQIGPQVLTEGWQDAIFEVRFDLHSRIVPESASSLLWAGLFSGAAGSTLPRRYTRSRPR